MELKKNHFYINGFALILALKLRFKVTRKWPIKNFNRAINNRHQRSILLIDYVFITKIQWKFKCLMSFWKSDENCSFLHP